MPALPGLFRVYVLIAWLGRLSLVTVLAKPCQPILAPVKFQFPQDLSQHPDQSVEWHWYVGNVHTADNRWYGVEVAIVRFAPNATHCGSQLDMLQNIYIVDLGLSDAANNKFYQVNSALLGLQVLGTTVHTPVSIPMFIESKGVFAVRQLGVNSDKYSLSAWGNDNASNIPIAVDLQLTDKLGNVPMALDGIDYSDGFLPGHGVGHIDQPWLDAAGSVSINGEIVSVTGQMTLQHMWYTSELNSTCTGWHWYTAQLSNGWSIAFTHTTLNHSPPPVFAPYAYGNILVPKSAGSTDLTNTYLNSTQYSVELQSPWISPHTNVTYWLHHIIRVPQFDMEMHFKPRIADNELFGSHAFFDAMHYYEGGSDVTGTIAGQSITGLGYTEMVGPSPLSQRHFT